jgi:hypothetical protein
MSSTAPLKTININPELFSMGNRSGGKTRRKRNSGPKDNTTKPKIKVKSPSTKNKQTGTIKRNLLKMFRNHYDSKMTTNTAIPEQKITPSVQSLSLPSPPPPPVAKTDFTSTLDYFREMPEPVPVVSPSPPPPPSPPVRSSVPITTLHNTTIRNYHSSPTISPSRASSLPLPPVLSSSALPQPPTNSSPIQLKTPVMVPQYGCLKNGNLPTFRTWKHATQKNHPFFNKPAQRIPVQHKESVVMNAASIPTKTFENQLNNQLREMTKRDEWRKQSSLVRPRNQKPKQQRRIIRRTFHVGKSKQHPRVSVLVSNRTIRNETNLKKSELKQTPIQDVKKYLLKQGFIKVGTTTPVDVLRQMYENARMICGEVKNHNAENLLYNYFNQADADSF